MRVQAKLVQIGNSWGIRLPKAAIELCGLRPGTKLDIEVRKGRLILRRPGQAVPGDTIGQAYKDVKAVWDEALEDVWFEVFGADE